MWKAKRYTTAETSTAPRPSLAPYVPPYKLERKKEASLGAKHQAILPAVADGRQDRAAKFIASRPDKPKRSCGTAETRTASRPSPAPYVPPDKVVKKKEVSSLGAKDKVTLPAVADARLEIVIPISRRDMP